MVHNVMAPRGDAIPLEPLQVGASARQFRGSRLCGSLMQRTHAKAKASPFEHAETVSSVLIQTNGTLGVQAVPLRSAMTILTEEQQTLPSPTLVTECGEGTKPEASKPLWTVATKPHGARVTAGSRTTSRDLEEDTEESPPMQGFSISYSNPDIRSILEESKDQKSSLRNSKCLVRSDEVVPSAAAAQEDRPFVCESSNVWSEPCDGVWNIDLGRASTLTDLLHPHLVKAANLNKLMERLTTPPLKSNVHVEEYLRFMRVFFMTYRSIATAEELLGLFKQRFNGPDMPAKAMNIIYPYGFRVKCKGKDNRLNGVRVAVCRCLAHWVEFHFTDFSSNSTLFQSFRAFCDEIAEQMKADDERLTRYDLAAIRNLLQLVESKCQKGTYVDLLSFGSVDNAPEPIISECRTLLDIHPLEIARQVTISQHHVYSEIEPVELQNLAWSNKKLKHRAKNLLRLIEQFNNLSKWCSASILSSDDVKERKHTMLHWLEVAKHCRELNNFNACMSIVSGFGNSAVHRLRQTFDLVNQSKNTSIDILAELRAELNSNQAFKVYRGLLASVNPPCMPFIGVFLTDLTFVSDGNPDRIAPYSLLNFRKLELEYDVIVQALKFQSPQYNLKLFPRVMQLIESIPLLTEDELFQRSLVCEPRKR